MVPKKKKKHNVQLVVGCACLMVGVALVGANLSVVSLNPPVIANAISVWFVSVGWPQYLYGERLFKPYDIARSCAR